eukprot:m.363903 g.363903  ORF g.363903 m.363903 type:complete len:99 (+) comp19963_c0_seq65:3212-3508(+)
MHGQLPEHVAAGWALWAEACGTRWVSKKTCFCFFWSFQTISSKQTENLKRALQQDMEKLAPGLQVLVREIAEEKERKKEKAGSVSHRDVVQHAVVLLA